jgi:hypothetical protein
MSKALKKIPLFWFNSFFIAIVFFFSRRDIIRASALDEDELISWSLIRLPWKSFFSAIYQDTQQPLYYFLLKIIHAFIPLQNDEWLRYPSLFLGLGTVLILYHYCSKNFSFLPAVLAVLFLIVHPEFKYFSVYARPYSLLYFLISMNAWSVMEIYYRKNEIPFFRRLFFISAILLCLTHYLAYFYFFILVLNLAVFKTSEFWKGWGKLIYVFFAFALFYIPLTVYQYKFRSFLAWVPDSFQNTLYTIKEIMGFSPSLPLTLLLLIAGFLIFFILRYVQNESKERSEILFLLSLQLTGILLFIIFSQFFFPVFVAKYLFIFFPFTILLISHVFTFFKISEHSGAVLFLIILFVNFHGLEKNENHWKFDSKEFFKQVHERHLVKESDRILCNSPRGPHKIFAGYSENFFGRDICSTYRFDQKEFAQQEYEFLINIKSLPKDPVFAGKLENYTVYFSSRDVELLKRK